MQQILGEASEGCAAIQLILEVFEAGVLGHVAEAKSVPLVTLWTWHGQCRAQA